MNNKKTIIITSAITAVAVFLLATIFYMSPFGSLLIGNMTDSPVRKNYGKLLRIESLVENEYMGSYNKEALMDNAVHTYVASLRDPYSVYYNKNEFKDITAELDGEYRGIGVVVSSTNNEILIKRVNPSSPAEKAGILPGDVILSVNGTAYDGSNLSGAVNAIKETRVGESVSLGIRRGGEIIDIDIKIEKVKEVLIYHRVLENNIGYISISTFGSSVAEDFPKALEELKKQGIKALVLDLRGNPGGTLDSAVAVADILLPEGNIVTIKDKKGNEQVYTSDKEEFDLPMCVLINGQSASASEVVSGALKDYGKAVIIGEKSFGKGVVQSVMSLGDGTGVSLTIAKYYTPSGECIHGIGIYPDKEVSLGEDVLIVPGEENPNDTQLAAAVDELNLQLKK